MNATEALAAAVRARLAQGSRQTGRIDMAALQTQVADGLANSMANSHAVQRPEPRSANADEVHALSASVTCEMARQGMKRRP